MPPSVLARNLVSRATAFAVGLGLAGMCVHLARGASQTIDEHPERQTMSERELDRQHDGVNLLMGAAWLTGVLAVSFIGFALLPAKMLYALPVGPPRDPRDDADSIEAFGRRL